MGKRDTGYWMLDSRDRKRVLCDLTGQSVLQMALHKVLRPRTTYRTL